MFDSIDFIIGRHINYFFFLGISVISLYVFVSVRIIYQRILHRSMSNVMYNANLMLIKVKSTETKRSKWTSKSETRMKID